MAVESFRHEAVSINVSFFAETGYNVKVIIMKNIELCIGGKDR